MAKRKILANLGEWFDRGEDQPLHLIQIMLTYSVVEVFG